MTDTPIDQKALEAAKAALNVSCHPDLGATFDLPGAIRAYLASLPLPVAGTPERWPEKVTAEMTNAFAAEAKRLGPDALQYPALLFNAMLTAAPLASEGKTEPVAKIDLPTLKWWRELVDLNPADLAPRLDDRIRALSTPPGAQPQYEPGAIRICPRRDGPCPHGMGCTYWQHDMDCSTEPRGAPHE